MRSKFYCKDCDYLFEDEGSKKEYMDPVFGPCSSIYAICPKCKTGTKEYSKPKHFKSSSHESMPPCGNPHASCSCCG